MNRYVQLVTVIMMTAVVGHCAGGNPIFRDVFTADPAAQLRGQILPPGSPDPGGHAVAEHDDRRIGGRRVGYEDGGFGAKEPCRGEQRQGDRDNLDRSF